MKKTILTISITLIGAIMAYGGSIWAVIAFIVYLVKDVPFNWFSVWSAVIGYLILVFAALFSAKSAYNKTKKRYVDDLGKPKKRSRFEERMNEIRNNNK